MYDNPVSFLKNGSRWLENYFKSQPTMSSNLSEIMKKLQDSRTNREAIETLKRTLNQYRPAVLEQQSEGEPAEELAEELVEELAEEPEGVLENQPRKKYLKYPVVFHTIIFTAIYLFLQFLMITYQNKNINNYTGDYTGSLQSNSSSENSVNTVIQHTILQSLSNFSPLGSVLVVAQQALAAVAATVGGVSDYTAKRTGEGGNVSLADLTVIWSYQRMTKSGWSSAIFLKTTRTFGLSDI